MNKIFFAASMLFASWGLGYCAPPKIRVKTTLSTPEIFAGQPIIAAVQVTNAGTVELELPRPDRAGFGALLGVDDPRLEFSGGVGIVSVTGEPPTVIVKPGESVETKVSLSGIMRDPYPITFRMGFKPGAGSVPVWSDPVTVRFKKDRDLPVKVEASIKDGQIDISNVRDPKNAAARVRIENTSGAPQNIGIAGVCCLHELQSLVSDNQAVEVDSGSGSCLSSACGPAEVVLNPGQVWEQECRLAYRGEDPNPKAVSFRIGVKSVGHSAAWGNPVSVNVSGGKDGWTKRVVYLKNVRKEGEATVHPDGISKTYDEDGAVMDVATYKRGKLNGPFKSYDNGYLWREINYADGKLDGRFKTYDKAGKLSSDELYSDGQLVSSVNYKEDGSIHGDMKFMKLENGNYVPLPDSCAEDDSDQEVLKMMPRCGASGNR